MAQVDVPDRLLMRPVQAAEDALRRLAYSDGQCFPVLLDSAARGPLSRYPVLAAYPQAALWQDGRGRLHTSGMPLPTASGFLDALEAAWRHDGDRGDGRGSGGGDLKRPSELTAGPFCGGWMVFLGYELAAEIEPQADLAPRMQSDAGAPGAFALRIPAGLVYDHVARQAWLFAEDGREELIEALSAALGGLWPGRQAPRPPG